MSMATNTVEDAPLLHEASKEALINEVRRRCDFGLIVTGTTTSPNFMTKGGMFVAGDVLYDRFAWGSPRDLASVSEAMATFFKQVVFDSMFDFYSPDEEEYDEDDDEETIGM